MNKQLYNFAQVTIQNNRQGGQIRNTALAKKLNKDFGFGQIDLSNKYLTFELSNILDLSQKIQVSHGVDIRNDPYPDKTNRLKTAEKYRNEKDHSYAVSKDFILINSLSSLKVNQTSYPFSRLTSLGHYIKADEIQSVEHSAVVLVENLAVMANLDEIDLTTIKSDIDLTQALWLYRGDVKAQQTSMTSYQFFRRFKNTIPLVCFSDLDPKGIEIALTSTADFWLTLAETDKVNLPLEGDEQEWYKQGASISFLNKQIQDSNHQVNKITKNQCWQQVFATLLTHRKTLKQEHMLKHKLTLSLIELNT